MVTLPRARITLLLATLVLLLGGCCKDDKCLNTNTGVDGERTRAPKIKTNLVYNDSVSSPRRDRTDWRYVMLTRPGKLTLLLHWDDGDSKLELNIFDVMGIKVQEGRVWGSGGLRAVVAVEEPGPYYIQVRAVTEDDKSHYSLRAIFEPQSTGGAAVCNDCKEGDRKCLGTASYIICEKVGPGCTQWTKTFPCPSEVACNNGMCDACSKPCVENTRRCVDARHTSVCVRRPGETCPGWGESTACPRKHRCHDGTCVRIKSGGGVVRPPNPPPRPSPTITKCKVISIYRYRGVWTLHLECPDNVTIRPGQRGTVLDGETGRPLAGGEIQVTRVSGRYAIATTSLQKLGRNRWVWIK